MRFHTSLPVTDVARSLDFYRVLFGTEPVKIKADYAKFLVGDGLNISFHENAAGADRLRPVHLGFQLDSQDELDRAHARLEAAGLISTERETAICCYANQDKFWVKDPDGYEWELYLLLEDTDVKIAPATSCCGPSTSARAEAADEGPAPATGCC